MKPLGGEDCTGVAVDDSLQRLVNTESLDDVPKVFFRDWEI